MGNDLAVSHQNKHSTVPQSGSTMLGEFTQRNEDSHLHKDVYTNIHSSFVRHSHEVETTQASFTREMAEQTTPGYLSYSRMLLTQRRDQQHTDTQVDLRDTLLSDKS